MTDDEISWARRAVACRDWKWVSGMRYRLTPGHPWARYEGDDYSDGEGLPVMESPPNVRCQDALPDLNDPATQGCLLHLVSEALRCPETHLYFADLSRLWVVRWGYAGRGRFSVDSPVKKEALVLALEAASKIYGE